MLLRGKDGWVNPLNAIICASSKGYMTGEIGVQWITVDFDPQTSEVANGCPWLLIVDGHSSHFT